MYFSAADMIMSSKIRINYVYGIIMNKLKYINDQKNATGAQLRKIRKKKKVTQADLAARMQVLGVNIDQQSISNIERNRRIVTDYELACFCKALHCTERELLQDFYDKLKEDE